jgi:hypothetical protein
MTKQIQEGFGQTIIDAIRSFARADLEGADSLESSLFAHVSEPDLRRNLAETLYGARWIYKLGLALLVKDEEQLAHVRTQIVDYSAVCEGLLSSMLHHALSKQILSGRKYRFNDTQRLTRPINWNVSNTLEQLKKRSFYWMIEVADEERIISSQLARHLHRMRQSRNTVHMRERNQRAFLGTSKSLFQTVLVCCTETKAWKIANP